jgi:Zn-dependent protease
VAAAGPVANILLAFVSAYAMFFCSRFGLKVLAIPFMVLFQINVSFAVFNLLPFPPLDGSRIVQGLLPYEYEVKYLHLMRYAPMILLGVFIMENFNLTQRFLGFGIFDILVGTPAQYLMVHIKSAVALTLSPFFGN